MSNVSAALVNLIGSVTPSGQDGAAPKQSKDGFSSLLDIVSAGSATSDKDSAPKEKFTDARDAQPVAVAIDTPVDTLTQNTVRPKEEPQAKISYPEKAASPERPPQASPADEPRAQQAKSTPPEATSASGTASADKPAAPAGAAPVTDALPAGQAQQLRDQLADIKQSLLAFIDALLGHTASQAGPASSVTATVQSDRPGLLLLAAQAAPTTLDGVDVQALAANSNQAGLPADLLADLKAVLQQLKDIQGEGDLAALTASLRNLQGSLGRWLEALKSQPADTDTKLQAWVAVAQQVRLIGREIEGAAAPAQTESKAPPGGIFSWLRSLLTGGDNQAKDRVAAKQDAPVAPVLVATPEMTGLQNTQPSTANQTIHLAAATAGQAAPASGDGSDAGNTGGRQDGAPLPVMAIRPEGGKPTEQTNAASPFARVLSQTAREPVLDQVTFHVRQAVSSGASRIHIQLDPAELGRLDIKLHVAADGKTGMTITADNKQTLDLLQRDSAGLQRLLNDAGLKADSGSLSFNLRGEQQQDQDFSQAASNYRKALPEEVEVGPVVTRTYVVGQAEGLDIRI